MGNDSVAEWRARWAKAIKAHRESVLHMSQPQLARHLGTATSTIAMWEAGANVPHDLMKIRLMVLMALDPRDMFRPLDTDPIAEVSK